ncbi:MAG: acyl-ACP--UDP-N-acetylglucosamine O-acyltransferase [Myxococcota bacterium]|nr:acyl-ACP--UDP-N-acetylglucosamine O-acyltransferase [Myxococcota bacterium]
MKTQETQIHPMSAVSPDAQLGVGVSVGPFAVIGPNVQIGDGCIIHSHAVLDGHTTLGSEVQVFPGAAVGLAPQDRKYDGSPTKLTVGDRTVLREYCTLQPGTTKTGTEITKIGADCLIMAYCHVAHDCVLGDNVILANGTQIAGHVTVEDHVILGGLTSVHQFVRIGTRAMTGASTRVLKDIPPFVTADGHPAQLVGLNSVGLKRAGFSEERVMEIKKTYRKIFLKGPFRETLEAILCDLHSCSEDVQRFVSFMQNSERGVTRGRARRISSKAQ